jgi:hypothetical protein
MVKLWIRYRFCAAGILMMAISILLSCGGGFDDETDNAEQFRKAVFNPARGSED